MNKPSSRVLVGGFKPEDIEKEHLTRKAKEVRQERSIEGAGDGLPPRSSQDKAGPRPTSPLGGHAKPDDGTIIVEKHCEAIKIDPIELLTYFRVYPITFNSQAYEVHIQSGKMDHTPSGIHSPDDWGKQAMGALESGEQAGFHAASSVFYAWLFYRLQELDRKIEDLPLPERGNRPDCLLTLRRDLDFILSHYEVATLTNGISKGRTIDENPRRDPDLGVHCFGTSRAREFSLGDFKTITRHTNPYPLTRNTIGPEGFSWAFFGLPVRDLAKAFGWITEDSLIAASVITAHDLRAGTSIPFTMWRDERSGAITFNLKDARAYVPTIGVRIYDSGGKAVLL